MNEVKGAVITGAGSGVGQAVAVALAHEGWRVALLGRREEALKETAAQIAALPSPHPEPAIYRCDVGDADAVRKVGQNILATFAHVDVLINSAGNNLPRRSLRELKEEDYRGLIDANLNGAYYCVQAFLGHMRERGSGTIINVVSDAGIQANPKAGPGYIASKFGLRGLTQAINLEERVNGIRACAIFPGDINTPLLDKRPNPPPMAARTSMLQAEDVAACIMLAINLPERAVIEEMLVRPR